MVRHIVLWKLSDRFAPEERGKVASEVKEALEGLNGVVPGLLRLRVHIAPLDGCSGEIMLESELESVEALRGYVVHPEHKRVGQFVRSVVQERIDMDFVEE